MAAALRRRKMSPLIPLGKRAGWTRGTGGGKGCQTRLGGMENRFSRGPHPQKNRTAFWGLCGSKTELTGNSRLHPLPPLDSGESHQSPTDQRHRNGLGHTYVELPGKRAPKSSVGRIDNSFNLQGGLAVDLRRERTAPKREGANRIGDI